MEVSHELYVMLNLFMFACARAMELGVAAAAVKYCFFSEPKKKSRKK